MADYADTHAPGLRPPYMPPPSAATALRQEMARTRQRLAAGVGEARELAAPSRLVASGAQAVRHAAVRRLSGLASRVSAPSRTPGSSRLGSAIALAVGAVATTGLARRRRARHSRPSFGTVSTVVSSLVRPGSPWLGLALSVMSGLARRR